MFGIDLREAASGKGLLPILILLHHIKCVYPTPYGKGYLKMQKEPAVLADSLKFGGGKRDRTADLLHAMQALYQLSYTPNFGGESGTRTPDTRIMIPLL